MPTLDYLQMFIPNSILECHKKTNEAKQRSDTPAFLKRREAKSEFELLLVCFFFKICQQICLGNFFFSFSFYFYLKPCTPSGKVSAGICFFWTQVFQPLKWRQTPSFERSFILFFSVNFFCDTAAKPRLGVPLHGSLMTAGSDDVLDLRFFFFYTGWIQTSNLPATCAPPPSGSQKLAVATNSSAITDTIPRQNIRQRLNHNEVSV